MSNNPQGRPLKRQRLSPPERTPPNAPQPKPRIHEPGTVIVKRNGKLYYDDGNIVLVAEVFVQREKVTCPVPASRKYPVSKEGARGKQVADTWHRTTTTYP